MHTLVPAPGACVKRGAARGLPTSPALLDQRLKAPFTADAKDVLYQWDSSRDSTSQAKFWKQPLAELLQSAPKR